MNTSFYCPHLRYYFYSSYMVRRHYKLGHSQLLQRNVSQTSKVVDQQKRLQKKHQSMAFNQNSKRLQKTTVNSMQSWIK